MPDQLTYTPSAERTGYVARFNAVVDYIDAHLGEVLDFQALAALAHFSPWHFHRLFHATMGETLAERVRRRRLESAARALIATPPATVQVVAFDLGFRSAEVFTRTFKAHFGVTPTAWRQGAHRLWVDERRTEMRRIHQARKPSHADPRMSADDGTEALVNSRAKGLISPMKVELKVLPEMRIAYIRHVGPYGDPKIGRLWERFMRWASHNSLLDGKRMYLGVSHDSADIAMPNKCRYDACVEVDSGFRPRQDVGVQELQGGLHACTRFVGTSDTIYEAWLRLYGDWLPGSAYQPDDKPCVEIYGVDVVVDPETGVFACDLCLPIRPLSCDR